MDRKDKRQLYTETQLDRQTDRQSDGQTEKPAAYQTRRQIYTVSRYNLDKRFQNTGQMSSALNQT